MTLTVLPDFCFLLVIGAGKGGDSFQMEMAQVGFSAHYSSKDVRIFGNVTETSL